MLGLLVNSNIFSQGRNGLYSNINKSTGSLVVSTGPYYCFGDANGSPLQNSIIDGTNWINSIGFRHYFPGNFAYKASLQLGNFRNVDTSKRNFSSDAQILGLTAVGEYAIPFGATPRYNSSNHNSIYIYLGTGVVSSTVTFPTNAIVGKANDLAVIFPFGLGYQYHFNNELSLGAEVGWQFSISDYIDGYHPDTFSNYPDILGGFNVTLAYKIFGRRGFLAY